MVAANFLLVYYYIGTLIDPDASSGVVLALTLLVWVNAVVRGLFFTQCWIAESVPGQTTGELRQRFESDMIG